MYEHKSEPLLPWGRFARRLLGHFIVALAVIFVGEVDPIVWTV